MTSKYAPQRQVPETFPDELRFLTKEALRAWSQDHASAGDSREWVMQFAQNYFAKGGKEAIIEARRQQDGAGGDGFPGPEELHRMITAIFHEADRDGNQFLDRKEFKKCLKLFANEMDLSVGDLRHIAVYADENGDGMISFGEFVPVAVELLQQIFARKKYLAEQAARQEAVVAESAAFLLNGMAKEDLDAALGAIFEAADTDHSGALSRAEFMVALKESDLGLTNKQIHLLADEADSNGDGEIQYGEAVPIMFHLLTELVAKQMEYDALPAEEQRVAEYLLDIFSQYDVDGSGRIGLNHVKEALRNCEIGLSKLQLRSVTSLAVPDKEGAVDYKVFAARAAGMLSSMLQVMLDSDKSARLLMERSRGAYAAVNGLGREEFNERLGQIMAALSPEGSHAHVEDLRAGLLSGCGTGMVFTEEHAGALVNLALEGNMGEDGSVDLAFVHEYAFDTLQGLQELEAMQGY